MIFRKWNQIISKTSSDISEKDYLSSDFKESNQYILETLTKAHNRSNSKKVEEDEAGN